MPSRGVVITGTAIVGLTLAAIAGVSSYAVVGHFRERSRNVPDFPAAQPEPVPPHAIDHEIKHVLRRPDGSCVAFVAADWISADSVRVAFQAGDSVGLQRLVDAGRAWVFDRKTIKILPIERVGNVLKFRIYSHAVNGGFQEIGYD